MSLKENVINKHKYTKNTINFLCYSSRAYHECVIKKKNGKERRLLIPCKTLKELQEELLEYIKSLKISNKFLNSQYAYTEKRNNIDYARIHLRSKYIIKFDIEDYFDSISFNRIVGTLKKHNVDEKDAVFIAQIACYRKDGKHIALAQGSPLSPILSNIVSTSIDKYFLKYIQRCKDVKYGRYADDICLSTDLHEDYIKINNDYKEIQSFLESIHYTLNNKKTKFLFKGKKMVGGIKINAVMNLQRDFINSLKLNLHHAIVRYEITRDKYCDLYSKTLKLQDKDNFFESSIRGRLWYLANVKDKNDTLVLKLKKMYNEINEFKYKFDLRLDYEKSVFSFDFVRFDSKGKDTPFQGTTFLTDFGLMTCFHNIYTKLSEDVHHGEFSITVLDDKRNEFVFFIKLNPQEIEKYEIKYLSEYGIVFSYQYDFFLISNDYLKENMPGYELFKSIAKPIKCNLNKNFYYVRNLDNIKMCGYPNNINQSKIVIRETKAKCIVDQMTYMINDVLGEGASGGPIIYKEKVIGIYRKGQFYDDHSEAFNFLAILDSIKNNDILKKYFK